MLPLVDKDNTKEIIFGVTFQHPEIIANAEVIRQELAEPYYWKLPKQFRGSMVKVENKNIPRFPSGSKYLRELS